MADMLELVGRELRQLEATQTFKIEVPLGSAQDAVVRVNGRKVVMLASNN